MTVFKTHPNFKCSFDYKIKDINDIIFFNLFKNQEKFTKKASFVKKLSYEEKQEKIKSFKIDPEKFDRIYYVHKEIYGDNKKFKYEIFARIDQGSSSSRPLCIHVKVYGSYVDEESYGEYFLTDKVNLQNKLMKNLIKRFEH